MTLGPRTHGFTLIEALASIGVMLILFGAMSSFLWELADRRTRLVRLMDDDLAATALMEALERDLMTCIAGAEGVGAGIDGSATALTVLSRGVLLSGERQADAMGDLQGASYTFDEERSTLTARRWSVGAEGASVGGGEEVLSVRVRRVRFRYHDAESWRGSFNSLSAGGLPVAVEVAVWFHPARWEPPEPEAEGEIGIGAEPASREELMALMEADVPPEEPEAWPEPHRLRVIAVPDSARERGAGAGL